MKFGRVLERAAQLGFDEVATGHHARVVDTANGPRDRARRRSGQGPVVRACTCSGPSELARTRLPIGELTKAEVRAHAHELGLRTADKRESMDVCFITRGGRERVPRQPHRPASGSDRRRPPAPSSARTTGSTRSRSVSGAGPVSRWASAGTSSTSRPTPATVTVGPRDALLRDRVQLRDVHRSRARRRPTCSRRSRAHGAPFAARLDGDTLVFATPQPRVAPGQVVAFYDGDVVLRRRHRRAELIAAVAARMRRRAVRVR